MSGYAEGRAGCVLAIRRETERRLLLVLCQAGRRRYNIRRCVTELPSVLVVIHGSLPSVASAALLQVSPRALSRCGASGIKFWFIFNNYYFVMN